MSDDVTRARMVPCPVCKMGADRRCVDIANAGPDGGGQEVDGVHQPRIYRAYVVAEADAHNRAVELEAELEQLRSADYLVWSNQHRMWWRGGESGYTSVIEEAGRYTKAHADSIVRNATCDGALRHERINPVTGLRYTSFDEVAIPAPALAAVEEVAF